MGINVPYVEELDLPFAIIRCIKEGEGKTILQIANIGIREYCLHSWLYYEKDSPIISDEDYDYLCEWLLKNKEWLDIFDTNKYLQKEMLECGSGYGLKIEGLTLAYCEKVYKGMKKP
jgi:hypothetical protein